MALAASLVHDLGHGPFSHAFEEVGRRVGLQTTDHEHVTDTLIRDSEVSEALRPLGSGFASDVADVIKRSGPGTLYDAVVSSQFDADRLDYIRRDRLMTGSEHAAIDFTWLVANLLMIRRLEPLGPLYLDQKLYTQLRPMFLDYFSCTQQSIIIRQLGTPKKSLRNYLSV